MIKKIILWILLTMFFAIFIFNFISFISNTTIGNVFREFEILLILFGISAILALNIVIYMDILKRFK